MCNTFKFIQLTIFCLLLLSTSYCSAQEWEEVSPSATNLDNNRDILKFITANGVHYLAYQGYSKAPSALDKGMLVMQLKNEIWSELAFFPRMVQLKLAVDKSNNIPYIAFQEDGGKYVVQKLENEQWTNLASLENHQIVNLNTFRLLIEQGIPYLSFQTWMTESQAAITVLKYEEEQWTQLGASIPIPKEQNYNLVVEKTTPYIAFIDKQNSPKVNLKKLENNKWVSLPNIPNEPPEIQNLNLAVQNDAVYISYNNALITKATVVQKLENNKWDSPTTIAHVSSYAAAQNLLVYKQTAILSHLDYSDEAKHSIEQIHNNKVTTVGHLAALLSCHLSLDQNSIYAAYKEETSDADPDFKNKKQSTIIIKKHELTQP